MYLSYATHLRQRGFGLGQPEGHVHSTVQSDSRGQFSAGLLQPVDSGIQCAEAQVTVGLERAHIELFGQGEGLAEVLFGQ